MLDVRLQRIDIESWMNLKASGKIQLATYHGDSFDYNEGAHLTLPQFSWKMGDKCTQTLRVEENIVSFFPFFITPNFICLLLWPFLGSYQVVFCVFQVFFHPTEVFLPLLDLRSYLLPPCVYLVNLMCCVYYI